MVKTIETSRLILRPFQLSDAPDLYDYAKRPEVGPNAGWDPHQSIEETKAVILRFMDQGDTWAIESKEHHKLIGTVGLHVRTDLKGRLHHELGFALSPDYQGKGYMTEAVEAVMEEAFLHLMISAIKIYHFIENKKSERLIHRLGFIYDQKVIYQTVAKGERIAKSYHLTREDYKIVKGIKK